MPEGTFGGNRRSKPLIQPVMMEKEKANATPLSQ